MWKKGNLKVGSDIFRYWIKVYESPSEFGINGGKVSKLALKRNGEIVYNYDRDEIIAPADKATELAIEFLLRSENN